MDQLIVVCERGTLQFPSALRISQSETHTQVQNDLILQKCPPSEFQIVPHTPPTNTHTHTHTP